MSNGARPSQRTEREDLGWREKVVSKQSRDVPKERSRTYYYSDGLFDRSQMWLKHTPGANIPIRVTKVRQPGLFDDDYDTTLEMNIGSEVDAYRLYLALEAYFNDVRTPPWFLSDVDSDGGDGS